MKEQTAIEERWNWLTHGLGVLLSLVGVLILIVKNTNKTEYSFFAILIYSFSLLILYFSSTIYHYSGNVVVKQKLRVMDHISIYLLIAGTYSPITLIELVNSKGLLLFILVWSLAVLGTVLKLFFTGKFEIISVLLYVIMGWLIVIDINQLTTNVGASGMVYLVLGGVAYTLGIIFYAYNKVNFNHVIWHLFVLAGSVFHYIFILEYII